MLYIPFVSYKDTKTYTNDLWIIQLFCKQTNVQRIDTLGVAYIPTNWNYDKNFNKSVGKLEVPYFLREHEWLKIGCNAEEAITIAETGLQSLSKNEIDDFESCEYGCIIMDEDGIISVVDKRKATNKEVASEVLYPRN